MTEARIRSRRNHSLRVERILRDQGICLVRLDRQQAHLVLRCDVLHSRRREARRDERCIDVAVLQGARRFPEGKELLIDIVVSDAIRLKNLACIGFRTAARRPDSDTLALEIGDALDPRRLKRDDLARLGIERCDAAQVLHLLVLEHLRAVHGVIGDVVLHDGEIDRTVLQHVDVRDRRTCGLRTRVHARNCLVQDFRHRAADRIIGARRSARGDIDELIAARTAAAGKKSHGKNQERCR